MDALIICLCVISYYIVFRAGERVYSVRRYLARRGVREKELAYIREAKQMRYQMAVRQARRCELSARAS